MAIHDPRKFIEELRDHLATHDKPIFFLFGAGTSSAINVAPPPEPGKKPVFWPLIPGIDGLTGCCAEAVVGKGEAYSAAWESLVFQCEQENKLPNVENILSKVRMKIAAIGEGETLVGLDRKGLFDLEGAICSSIANAVTPSDDAIPDRIPHDEFATWVKRVNRSAPLEIFTLNYDILFERAFEASRVPVFDGFVGAYEPFFYPECLDEENILPNAKWVRLWKLHGSVNWKFIERHGIKRLLRGNVNKSGEMILPSHQKYDESRKQPYISYIDRLASILNTEHALLITCGYGFGDEHINAIIYTGLDNRSTTNVVVLSFPEIKEGHEIVQAALKRRNLAVIAPNAGVISGTWGTWQLTQPVDHKTYSFMDSAFDSNAAPEEEGSPATGTGDLTGKIRLGDFNWFCRFLNAMGVGVS
ncbi:MAG: SIR2 family protein [Desulfobaccales bacterium]